MRGGEGRGGEGEGDKREIRIKACKFERLPSLSLARVALPRPSLPPYRRFQNNPCFSSATYTPRQTLGSNTRRVRSNEPPPPRSRSAQAGNRSSRSSRERLGVFRASGTP